MVEPLNLSILSMFLPIYKLPSSKMEICVALNIFRALVLSGNIILMSSLSLVFGLCKLDLYNPWTGNMVTYFNYCLTKNSQQESKADDRNESKTVFFSKN